MQILVANRNQLPGLTRVKIHFYIIPPSIPKSSKLPHSLKLLHHKPVCTSPLPHTWQMPCHPHPSWFDHSSNNHNKIILSSLIILQKRMNFKWGDVNSRRGGDLIASVEKEDKWHVHMLTNMLCRPAGDNYSDERANDLKPATVWGGIQNFLDWSHHLYSSCGSVKHQ